MAGPQSRGSTLASSVSPTANNRLTLVIRTSRIRAEGVRWGSGSAESQQEHGEHRDINDHRDSDDENEQHGDTC
jgi:hypothetical protein